MQQFWVYFMVRCQTGVIRKGAKLPFLLTVNLLHPIKRKVVELKDLEAHTWRYPIETLWHVLPTTSNRPVWDAAALSNGEATCNQKKRRHPIEARQDTRPQYRDGWKPKCTATEWELWACSYVILSRIREYFYKCFNKGPLYIGPNCKMHLLVDSYLLTLYPSQMQTSLTSSNRLFQLLCWKTFKYNIPLKIG